MANAFATVMQVVSGRSTVASLQEVLQDAVGHGTQESDLYERLAARLQKAEAWSNQAAAFFAAVEAAKEAANNRSHPQGHGHSQGSARWQGPAHLQSQAHSQGPPHLQGPTHSQGQPTHLQGRSHLQGLTHLQGQSTQLQQTHAVSGDPAGRAIHSGHHPQSHLGGSGLHHPGSGFPAAAAVGGFQSHPAASGPHPAGTCQPMQMGTVGPAGAPTHLQLQQGHGFQSHSAASGPHPAGACQPMQMGMAGPAGAPTHSQLQQGHGFQSHLAMQQSTPSTPHASQPTRQPTHGSVAADAIASLQQRAAGMLQAEPSNPRPPTQNLASRQAVGDYQQAADGRGVGQRPSLADLEALATDGNLLGVKLDMIGDVNAALSDVRAWLKQVTCTPPPPFWVSPAGLLQGTCRAARSSYAARHHGRSCAA